MNVNLLRKMGEQQSKEEYIIITYILEVICLIQIAASPYFASRLYGKYHRESIQRERYMRTTSGGQVVGFGETHGSPSTKVDRPNEGMV